MKPTLNLKIGLLLLIALVLIVPISYGQSKQKTITQSTITKSIDCFEEIKAVRIIINTKDTQIMSLISDTQNLKILADTLRNDNIVLTVANEKKDIIIKSKNNSIEVLKWIVIIETIALAVKVIW